MAVARLEGAWLEFKGSGEEIVPGTKELRERRLGKAALGKKIVVSEIRRLGEEVLGVRRLREEVLGAETLGKICQNLLFNQILFWLLLLLASDIAFPSSVA